MEKLIFDKRDVFTSITADDAEMYLGKEGYFGDTLSEIETAICNTDSGTALVLKDILPDEKGNHGRFEIDNDWNDQYESSFYHLFLPLEKVNGIKKKHSEDLKHYTEVFNDIYRVTLTVAGTKEDLNHSLAFMIRNVTLTPDDRLHIDYAYIDQYEKFCSGECVLTKDFLSMTDGEILNSLLKEGNKEK